MARNTERKRPCNIPKSIIITLWVTFYECSITRLKKTTHILFMECIVRPTLDFVESNIPFTLVLNKYLLIECFLSLGPINSKLSFQHVPRFSC